MKTLKQILFMTTLLTLFGYQAQSQNSLSDSSQNKKNSAYFMIQDEVVSKNIQRSMNFGNKPMNHVYIEGGNDNFSGFAWTNQSFDNLDTLVEVDVGFSYTGRIKLGENKKKEDITLVISPNVVNFSFPNSNYADCRLVGLTTSVSGLPVVPKIDSKKGFGSSNGYFVNASVTGNLPVGNKINLSATAEIEYNNQFFSNGAGFIATAGSGNISYTPIPNLKIDGTCTFQKALDKSHTDAHTESLLRLAATYTFK